MRKLITGTLLVYAAGAFGGSVIAGDQEFSYNIPFCGS
jgi:hypothetical protein